MKAYLSINADHTLADWPTFGQDAYKAAVARHQRAAEAEARRILAEHEPPEQGPYAACYVSIAFLRASRMPLHRRIVADVARDLTRFINLEVF